MAPAPRWALRLLLALISASGAAAEVCATFTPSTCLHGPDVHYTAQDCRPQPCKFDVEAAWGSCGFPESGTYSYAASPAGGCADPFMSMRRGAPAACGDRCCRTDLPGDFETVGTVGGTEAARYVYQPADHGCRYAELSRGQVLHYLRTRGASILVVGDSMLRQLFLRLVMLMRGQAHHLDFHMHTHMQYATCGEADAFRVSNNNNGTDNSSRMDYSYSRDIIPAFFRADAGPGRLALRGALAACSRRPVEMHFMFSPLFFSQATALRAYMAAAPPGSKPVVVSGVMYWEGSSTVPQGYLDSLAALKGRALKVFVVSAPTVKVVGADRRAAYRARNAFLRAWVAEQGEPFAFLDYDTMSLARNAPPGESERNWHYMCDTSWKQQLVDRSDGGGKDGATPVPQIKRGVVARVHGSEDELGQCVDEMNRNLWQVAFNAVVAPARGGA